jgi:hypothetical protein
MAYLFLHYRKPLTINLIAYENLLALGTVYLKKVYQNFIIPLLQ